MMQTFTHNEGISTTHSIIKETSNGKGQDHGDTESKPLTVSGDNVTLLMYLPHSTHLSLSVSITSLPLIRQHYS